MPLGRAQGDDQRVGDLLVAVTVHEQAQDLKFAAQRLDEIGRRRRLRWRHLRRGRPAAQFVHKRGRGSRAAGSRDANAGVFVAAEAYEFAGAARANAPPSAATAFIGAPERAERPAQQARLDHCA
ncbi:MAG: hypothetical protein R2851_15920 [Caldilineaceae bacterium]